MLLPTCPCLATGSLIRHRERRLRMSTERVAGPQTVTRPRGVSRVGRTCRPRPATSLVPGVRRSSTLAPERADRQGHGLVSTFSDISTTPPVPSAPRWPRGHWDRGNPSAPGAYPLPVNAIACSAIAPTGRRWAHGSGPVHPTPHHRPGVRAGAPGASPRPGSFPRGARARR